VNTTLRSLAAPVAALALALTGVALSASPAAAATPGYSGTNAPLEWNGTTFDDPPPGASGTGAVYLSGDDDRTWVDAPVYQSLVGIAGTSNLHAVLATYDFGSGPQDLTIYVSDLFLQNEGPYPATCAGANDALFGGDPACQAFKADILTANGAGSDFTFTGLSGFVDSADNPTSDPSLAAAVPPDVVWADYQGTASPLSLDGTDYTASTDGTPGTGSTWAGGGSPGVFITGGDDRLPNFPRNGGGTIYPAHSTLIEVNGQPATGYFDGALLYLLDPMNPFPASCPGFEAFMAAVSQPGIECIAFRADTWAPPDTLGEQYTCATDWYDGWTDENGDPLGAIPTVVDGFSPPALTPVGVDTGPGVCPAYVPPEPPTPPAPPAPPGPDGPDGPGTGAGTGTGTGTGTGGVPTLPATGVGTSALALAALALLAAGAGFTLATRRRVTTPTKG